MSFNEITEIKTFIYFYRFFCKCVNAYNNILYNSWYPPDYHRANIVVIHKDKKQLTFYNYVCCLI